MKKLILAVATSALLAGCAGVAGHTRSLGSVADSTSPYYDDRYWPPVMPGQAFPAQMMDGASHD